MRPRKAQDDDATQDRDFVVALARGLDLLRTFDREGEALGNKDFATRTGLSKSTVSRLTYTLHRLGYLSYNPETARYRLAPPVLGLGFSCLAGMPVRQIAKPIMRDLADWSGMPVAMASRDRLAMVYLERCPGAHAISLTIEVGARISLAKTAVGRAAIAAMDEADRAALLDDIRADEGSDWPTVERGIEAALESHARRGYCLSLEEWRPGVNAVAVPLRPRDGSPIIAFNCGGPAQTLTRETLERDIAPRLIEVVQRVAAVTG